MRQPNFPAPRVRLHTALLLTLAFCFPALLSPVNATAQDKGKLYVDTDVSTPIIRILNNSITFYQGMKLPPGNYVIQVGAEGYSSITKSVTVIAGKDTRLNVSFKKKDKKEEEAKEEESEKTGDAPKDSGKEKLFVEVTPKDARVRVLNIAPKFEQGLGLGPGEYIVEVSKDGLEKQVRTVRIVKGKDLKVSFDLTKKAPETADKKAEETPKEKPQDMAGTEKDKKAGDKPLDKPSDQPTDGPGRLYVKASPTKAIVKLQDVDLPFKQGMSLTPGKYVIKVSFDGYEATELTAEVFAGKDTRVSINLEPERKEPVEEKKEPPTEVVEKGKERIYVETIPEDASVRILNIAPKFEQGMPLGPGVYEVEVKKKGYDTQVRNVEIKEGRHMKVTFDLRPPEERKEDKPEKPVLEDPTKGKLFVTVDVPDAVIKLMDLPIQFEQGMELPSGSYRIEIAKEGVGRKELTAAVTSGNVIRVRVKLGAQLEKAQTKAQQEALEQRMQTLFQQIQEAELAKDTGKALSLAEEAVNAAPHEAQTYLVRGNLLFESQKVDQALKDFDQSIELDPDNAAPYLSRGKAYVLKEDRESACYDFWQACALGHCEAISTAQKEGFCR